jgi:hypothetical protein
VFSDLLDEPVYGIKVGPDVDIPARKTHIDEGRYSINRFINAQSRMMTMKKADIKAKLVVHRIVFSDNTVLKVEK